MRFKSMKFSTTDSIPVSLASLLPWSAPSMRRTHIKGVTLAAGGDGAFLPWVQSEQSLWNCVQQTALSGSLLLPIHSPFLPPSQGRPQLRSREGLHEKRPTVDEQGADPKAVEKGEEYTCWCCRQ
ncbi:hypothetical protein TNCV_4085501 [Trichonephila clavipes]|nr:hypothetical protein TNCV_4085501 [Trichonephila clavipes]